MPLPDLTTDTSVTTETIGRLRLVSGRLLVVLPYGAPVGKSRGRRYRADFDSGDVVSRVVLSVTGCAALRPPDSLQLSEDESVRLRLRALPTRRAHQVPEDLERHLAAADASLDDVDEADIQHLLLMVAEAKDPAIRAERIRAAVDAARATSGVRQ